LNFESLDSSVPFRRKLLLLLASIRFANLPSVVSNVWLGVALGVRFFDPDLPSRLWLTASLLGFAGLALYVSGNFLNDWQDRHWDARHRPERALPQGAFTPTLYLGLAILCATVGVALASFVGLPSGGVAGLIVLCIVGYTRWHKTAEWPVLLMGLCRGLLPVMFFIACWWPNQPTSEAWQEGGWQLLACYLWILVGAASPSLALTLYVVALSRIARHETVAPPVVRNSYPVLLCLLAGFVMTVIPVRQMGPFPVLGLLPFVLWLALCWTRFGSSPGRQVAALLAGLPLLDWVALLPLGLWMLDNHAPVTGYPSIALVSLLLPLLAFLAGRLLQRLTPAT
jgi:hypothetical protein